MSKSQQKVWFSQQIEENIDALYSMATRLTKNNIDAENLIFDSVIKAWKSLHRLKNKNRFRPWIFNILQNDYINTYRSTLIQPVAIGYRVKTS